MLKLFIEFVLVPIYVMSEVFFFLHQTMFLFETFSRMYYDMEKRK